MKGVFDASEEPALHIRKDEERFDGLWPERAERNKGFEIDDLRPWSEEMKPWFSAVCVLGTTAFSVSGDD